MVHAKVPSPKHAAVKRKAVATTPSPKGKGAVKVEAAPVKGKGKRGQRRGARRTCCPGFRLLERCSETVLTNRCVSVRSARVKSLVEGRSVDGKRGALESVPARARSWCGYCGRARRSVFPQWRRPSLVEGRAWALAHSARGTARLQTLPGNCKQRRMSWLRGRNSSSNGTPNNTQTCAMTGENLWSPSLPTTPTPEPEYRPGEWGARFAAQNLERTAETTPTQPRVDKHVTPEAVSTEAELAYRKAE